MKSGMGKVLVVIGLVLALSSPALAIDKLVETVVKGCEKELSSYCKDVTPGEGRVLACLYAHSDKLSGKCEYALYDAAAQLERFIAALTYVANECDDDLKNFCSGVKPGEGRILDCMEKSKDKLSDRCKQAISDTGLKRVK